MATDPSDKVCVCVEKYFLRSSEAVDWKNAMNETVWKNEMIYAELFPSSQVIAFSQIGHNKRSIE